MHQVVIICGPTAVGKSRIALLLCQRMNGEIVSADSQQVYRGMDIGTAKPSALDRALVQHHLIDVLSPDEHFDVAMFQKLADRAIEDISRRKKLPFVVGGTGMYLQLLMHGICPAPPRDSAFRQKLEVDIQRHGLGYLYERLKMLDPVAARHIPLGDRTRLIRALEVSHTTGLPMSRIHAEHQFREVRYRAMYIGLTMDRALLYQRINARVDHMMSIGFLGEVEALLAKYDSNSQAFRAVGYRELIEHLKGVLSLDEAISLIKQNSRRFAKRQLTWFRRNRDIRWFSPGEEEAIHALIDSAM